MHDKDLYQILGVKPEASAADVRKAYHQIAKKYHPDVNSTPEGEQKFKEANLAYEVLKDAEKRKKYDQMRANPFAHASRGSGAGAGSQGGGGRTYHAGNFGPEMFNDLGLGDLFSEIFGGGDFYGARQRPGSPRGAGGSPFAQKGANREADLPLIFEEAALGGEKKIELPGGKQISVSIPAGIKSGGKIKLSGLGGPGANGGPNGDLLLVIRVKPHKHFRREDDDVILTLPITVQEAVLGTEIQIPTLTGRVHLKLPQGVSSGQRLKLKGKGIRSPGGTKVGDQIVEVSIKVPKKPNAKYKELVEKLNSESFNPRDF